MSALALVTKEWGAEVGGSDRARSSYVERLEAAAIAGAIGHAAANATGAEVRGRLDRGLAAGPAVAGGAALERVAVELGVRGRHNRLSAAAALEALELAGGRREVAEAVLPGFRGVGGRFERRGEAGGV